MSEIRWRYFPQIEKTPEHLLEVIEVFKENKEKISSKDHKHNSNKVLKFLTTGLQSIDYNVEENGVKIGLPVLIGENDKVLKRFDVDAHNRNEKTIIEVEAGQAVDNNKFLKDLMKACLLQDIDYLVIASRIIYGTSNSKNFETISNFIELIYTSRLKLPIKGCLIVGY